MPARYQLNEINLLVEGLGAADKSNYSKPRSPTPKGAAGKGIDTAKRAVSQPEFRRLSRRLRERIFQPEGAEVLGAAR